MYATLTEATERVIIEALGDYGDDYDIEAIANEIFEWSAEFQDNMVLANQSGFVLKEKYLNDPDLFWEVAEAHELVPMD